jgi:hypothetical protein
MENSITWKDVFKSIFLKDLIYILPLIFVKLGFRHWVAPKLSSTTGYQEIAIYVEVLTTIGIVLIMIIELTRKKGDERIKEFILKEVEKDKGKNFDLSGGKVSNSFKFMLLHILQIIFYSIIIGLISYSSPF